MFRNYIPTTSAEDWHGLLADTEKHWKTGYSARTLAYCWEDAKGEFPQEVGNLFAMSEIPALNTIKPLLGIVEHPVSMPGQGWPSHNDLFVLAKAEGGLASITVEGKVEEDFGDTLEDWKPDGSPNKQTRLTGIVEAIGLQMPVALTIRYQLLHRMASAVYEAKRFNASYAIMLIHSFSKTQSHFDDFKNFVGLYNKVGESSKLISLTSVDGIELLTAWVKGNPEYLSK